MNNRRTKIIIVAALLISIIGLSVGYAAYSSILKISGTLAAKPTSDSWKIVFKSMNNDNILNPVLGGNATEATSANLTDTTISGFKVNFLAPGDQVTYNFKVVNEGKTDAKLSLKSIGTLTCTPSASSTATQSEADQLCKDVSATLTYADGTPIITNTNLNSGDEKQMKLVIKWNLSSALMLSGDVDITVGESSLTYTQYVGPSTLLENSTAKYCTYDGDMVQGAEYTDGTYTYRYKQEVTVVSYETPYSPTWGNVTEDGWGVVLTDKTYTGAISEQPCTYINNLPIISMALMFEYSQAAELYLSSFDTTQVTNMIGMFANSETTNLDLSSFNTSKVTNMSYMFCNTKVYNLDLSSFDTHNVTDMSWMFSYSQVTELDMSSFDTSKVTNMSGMFTVSKAYLLNLSSFDTSSVTNMRNMFASTQATVLDLSSFDTSNVTNMGFMFATSKASSLDLSNFDTSKVADMSYMFTTSQISLLNLSSFNTSQVTNMSYMFAESNITSLDLSSFEMNGVTNTYRMFLSAKAITGYAKDATNAAILNGTSGKPSTLTFVVK